MICGTPRSLWIHYYLSRIPPLEWPSHLTQSGTHAAKFRHQVEEIVILEIDTVSAMWEHQSCDQGTENLTMWQEIHSDVVVGAVKQSHWNCSAMSPLGLWCPISLQVKVTVMARFTNFRAATCSTIATVLLASFAYLVRAQSVTTTQAFTNYSEIIGACVGLGIWMLIVFYGLERIIGYIVTIVVRRSLQSADPSELKYFSCGGLTFSLAAGKIKFKDLYYIDGDMALSIMDGIIKINYKKARYRKDIADTGSERLVIEIRGLSCNMYNKRAVYKMFDALCAVPDLEFGGAPRPPPPASDHGSSDQVCNVLFSTIIHVTDVGGMQCMFHFSKCEHCFYWTYPLCIVRKPI